MHLSYPKQHTSYNSPSQVDSVYTRSTPMMEAVKIGGRLDLIECLIAAGGQLDVQVGVSHYSPFRAVCQTLPRCSNCEVFEFNYSVIYWVPAVYPDATASATARCLWSYFYLIGTVTSTNKSKIKCPKNKLCYYSTAATHALSIVSGHC